MISLNTMTITLRHLNGLKKGRNVVSQGSVPDHLHSLAEEQVKLAQERVWGHGCSRRHELN